MRVAFLSPLPPTASGVADHSADVLSLLAGTYELDVFHDQDSVDRSTLPPDCDVQPVSAFVERHRKRPYDVAVYQMGNGRAHGFLYDPLARVPGLLVLHDLVLHHSRAAWFLEADDVQAWRRDPSSPAAREAARPWLDRWKQELSCAYPGKGDRLFEAHLGTSGRLLAYAYPLLRLPVEASRLVGVHSDFAVDVVKAEVPGARVTRLVMPVTRATVDPEVVAERRRQLGFAEGDVVVGSFGLMTPEKRIPQVARAVARVAASDPRIRLLLAGPVPDRAHLEEQLEEEGVTARTVVTGRVALEELPVLMEASDVVVHLRYPTARETSAALLRVLAQGRPTVVADLQHQAEIPRDAVRHVDVEDEVGGVAQALSVLAADPDGRRELGRRAAEFARRKHSAGRARASWRNALEAARAAAPPAPRKRPAHWPRPEPI